MSSLHSNGNGAPAASLTAEYADSQPTPVSTWDTELVILSGADRATLLARIQELRRQLAHRPETRVLDLAHTLNRDLPRSPLRAAFVCKDIPDLLKRLDRAASRLADPSCRFIRDAMGLYFTEEPLGPRGKVAYLFPGEGAQYLNMLEDLCHSFPEVRETIQHADLLMESSNQGLKPISRFIYFSKDATPEARAAAEAELRTLGNAIYSVLMCDRALLLMLEELRLKADVIAGHSAGELEALWAAGALNTQEVLQTPIAQTMLNLEAQEESAEQGATLLAVGTDRASAAELLRNTLVCSAAADSPGAFVAMDNCPHQTVLVGRPAIMQQVEQALQAKGWVYERLSLKRGYHTTLFEESMGPLRAMFASAPFQLPAIPVYSCTTAQPFPNDPQQICELAVSHWARPVEFTRMIRQMHADGCRIFLEVGPRGNLSAFVEDILRGQEFLAIPVNSARRSGTTQLNHMAGQLAVHQVELDLAHLYERRLPKTLDWALPLRSVDRPVIAAAVLQPASNGHALPSPVSSSVPESNHARSYAKMAQNAISSVHARAQAAPDLDDNTAPAALPAPLASNDGALAPTQAAPASATANSAGQVMLDYCQVMDQFLQTQSQVMQSYLHRSRAGGSLPTGSLPPGPRPGARARSRISRAAAYPGGDAQPLGPLFYIPQPQAPQSPSSQLPGSQAASSQPHLPRSQDLSTQPCMPASVDPSAVEVPVDAAPLPGEIVRPHGPLLGNVLAFVQDEEITVRRKMLFDEDLYATEHTVGGRHISKFAPDQHGLPIAPMTFSLELMAEVARYMFPHLVVTRICNVQLLRWLAVEHDLPINVEARGKVQPVTDQDRAAGTLARIQVEIRDLGNDQFPPPAAGYWLAQHGTVELSAQYPPAPVAQPLVLKNPRPCTVTIPRLYRNLFHGPMFEGVTSLDQFGDNGIEARVVVMPRDGVFRSRQEPGFEQDPVLMDVMMHPLAAWHLEQPDQAGRVLLPFALKSVQFFSPPPAVGTPLTSQGTLQLESSKRFTHSVEASGPDGRVWCRLEEAKYWRFYMPFGEVNFHGPKDEYFMSELWPECLPLELPGKETAGTSLNPGPMQQTLCVRLSPPADAIQNAMHRVICQITMGPAEMQQFRRLKCQDARRVEWIFGRLAAKDALRLLWHQTTGERFFPADLHIGPDAHGRPVARPRDPARSDHLPTISLAHSHGLCVGLAAFGPFVGIDLEKVEAREAGFESIAFDSAERRLLDQLGPDRSLWITRLWCAKEAVGKALGRGLIEGPRSLFVTRVGPHPRQVVLQLGPTLATLFPQFAEVGLVAWISEYQGFVAATTLCQSVPLTEE